MLNDERRILRELAFRAKEIAERPIQDERRELWRSLNSLRMARPMVNVNKFMWWQELYPDESTLLCRHEALRPVERELRQRIFQDWLGDDTVIEPFVALRAAYGPPYVDTPEMGDMYWARNTWGLHFSRIPSGDPNGAWAFDPSLKELEDFEQLTAPRHVIDEERTAANLRTVRDCIGDILPVAMDRGPMVRAYSASILHDLCQLRGYENVLTDLYENPEWLHKVISFMADGVFALHGEVERKGDFKLLNTFNQTMTYCDDLPDPAPADEPVPRSVLWNFLEGQEFDCVSPALTDEFCIQYHKKIAGAYGLTAYGCCENLTLKIGLLRQIPNLRIIAVAPWANLRSCAEQAGKDYVLSWRPNPAATLCNGFDKDELIRSLQAAKADAAGANYEINLKDVKTIRKDKDALKSWVDAAMGFVQSQ